MAKLTNNFTIEELELLLKSLKQNKNLYEIQSEKYRNDEMLPDYNKVHYFPTIELFDNLISKLKLEIKNLRYNENSN